MRLKILRNFASCQKQVQRQIHLTKAALINPKNVREVKIPVPWGHIAGKWWGDAGRQPILALHGWLDNAGTWDPLLECLPESDPVLAIDSPGHGFSSHFPQGMLYHNINYVMMLRRLQLHFQWNSNLKIIGHSGGATLGFMFAVLYPEVVNTLIAIDAIKPFAQELSHKEKLASGIDKLIMRSRRFTYENRKYSLEDVEKRWTKGMMFSNLTVDGVKTLMKRGIKLDRTTGQYSFNRDHILKISPVNKLDVEQSLEMARNLKCHYLVIRCTDSPIISYMLKNSPNFIKTLGQSAKSFKLVDVEGCHHVHLTHPDRVLPVITDFLDKDDGFLKSFNGLFEYYSKKIVLTFPIKENWTDLIKTY